jgi:hypothetical protein
MSLTEDRRRTGWREIRHYAHVDRDFGQVRSYLAATPDRLLSEHRPAHDDGGLRTGLHVQRAGLDLSRDVRVVLGDLELSTRSIRVPLRWEDARRPGLFPVLDATLEIVPVTAGHYRATQIGFVGRYQPPLGRLGAVADSVAGHRLVLESVEGFVESLATRLEHELAEIPPARPDGERHGEAVPNRLRRAFLPVEDVDHRSGGAAGVKRRLEEEPGVVAVQVDPARELAVVEYDATICGLSRLLALLEPAGAGPNED